MTPHQMTTRFKGIFGENRFAEETFDDAEWDLLVPVVSIEDDDLGEPQEGLAEPSPYDDGPFEPLPIGVELANPSMTGDVEPLFPVFDDALAFPAFDADHPSTELISYGDDLPFWGTPVEDGSEGDACPSHDEAPSDASKPFPPVECGRDINEQRRRAFEGPHLWAFDEQQLRVKGLSDPAPTMPSVAREGTDEAIAALASRNVLQGTPLRALVESVRIIVEDDGQLVPHVPNAVYFPMSDPAYPVVESADGVLSLPCARIVLQADRCYSAYMVRFFESELGRKVRQKLWNEAVPGTLSRRITRSQLLNAEVYIPTLDNQTRIINLHRSIREMSVQLEGYERELWDRPGGDIESIERGLARLTPRNSFEEWVETLPFPLASILWRYHADSDVPTGNSHLFSFFEACAQFVATLMLSAFHDDPELFDGVMRRWGNPDSTYGMSLKRSTFGSWVTLGERLAKETRRLLMTGDPEKEERCYALYKTRNRTFLEAISSRVLFSVLRKVNTYRNDWKGHGGLEGRQEAIRRHALLQNELANLKVLFSNHFEDFVLLQPGAGIRRGGVHVTTVKSLKGSRTIFKKVEVETTMSLDVEKLYFLDPETHHPLEMLPFFKMMQPPRSEDSACYFYNRLEKDNIRWVSYHFDQENEVFEADFSLMSLIDQLN